MKSILQTTLLIAAVFQWGEPSVAQTKPMRDVTTVLLEDVAAFARRNDAKSNFDEMKDPSAWFQASRDDPNFAGLRLRYSAEDCDYAFPPGRFLEVAQSAGQISFITYIMPLATLSFEEAVALAGDIRAGVREKGWTETRWYGDVSSEAVANNPGEKSAWIGKWRPCGRAGQEAGLSIKDAGAEFVGTSVPLNAQKRIDPVKPGGEYLLVLEIYKSAA